MNNQNQTKRQNSIAFTGNVSKVKPLNGGACAISLAYNEGSQVNGQWETTDTLFMECYIPAKLNFIPGVGDKMTITGFLASNNYTPQQGGNKRYGVKIVVNQIDEYSPKQANQSAAQQQYQPQGQYQQPEQQYQPQGQYQQPAPQQYQPQGGQQPQQRPQQQYQPQGGQQPQQRPQQQYQARPQHYQPQQNFQENGGFTG
ncbi:hypothetical protein TUM3794_19970 [Shewanella colwelliana]|uniref:Single-stranded DNA-binding protein n=1 Tax=Shewanella colwelliana TaxID=23 RepID=A0ABQ4P098_SHECO|nr:single-stranded DNA-binding protein [Shewanella colwelliana]GIU40908.1 hypothetical protein TUM3794_19970 [Shewanella colwelliana]